jgi:hypothetical protein
VEILPFTYSGEYATLRLTYPRLSLNLIHEGDFVKVRFEPLGYLGRLPHVLGRFLVLEHSLKRLSTPPLSVVGDPRAVEAPVDVG